MCTGDAVMGGLKILRSITRRVHDLGLNIGDVGYGVDETRMCTNEVPPLAA